MGRHSLLFGKSHVEFDLEGPVNYPRGADFKIDANTPAEALKDPLGSPGLEEMAERVSSIAVVIPDATRSWQNISLMAEAVRSSLGKIERVDWIIGGGQHRLPTEEEIYLLLGNARREKDHLYCHDSNLYVDTGLVTSGGNPVTLHRKVFEVELVVLIGGIAYHDLAGFSGGRKAIIPGISGRESIIKNHSFCLENGIIVPSIGCGKLKGNPVHEDMMEYAGLAMAGKQVFILNVIPDERGLPWRYVAGDLVSAWERGVKTAQELQTLSVPEKADWAIVSPGGYPYDIDLYQATKSISAVLGALKKGSAIVIVAELEDGSGPGDYGEVLEVSMKDPRRILAELKRDFTIPAFCAFKLVLDLNAHPSILVSPQRCVPFPGLVCNSVGEAMKILKTRGLLDGVGLILPAGNSVVLQSK